MIGGFKNSIDNCHLKQNYVRQQSLQDLLGLDTSIYKPSKISVSVLTVDNATPVPKTYQSQKCITSHANVNVFSNANVSSKLFEVN